LLRYFSGSAVAVEACNCNPVFELLARMLVAAATSGERDVVVATVQGSNLTLEQKVVLVATANLQTYGGAPTTLLLAHYDANINALPAFTGTGANSSVQTNRSKFGAGSLLTNAPSNLTYPLTINTNLPFTIEFFGWFPQLSVVDPVSDPGVEYLLGDLAIGNNCTARHRSEVHATGRAAAGLCDLPDVRRSAELEPRRGRRREFDCSPHHRQYVGAHRVPAGRRRLRVMLHRRHAALRHRRSARG